MAVILHDTFTGPAGELSAHTSDSGHSWAGSGWRAEIDGAGFLVGAVSNGYGAFAVDAVVPQAPLTLSMDISIGAFPAVAYDYTELIRVALWGNYDHAIEVRSRDAANGNAPRIYISTTTLGGGLVAFEAPIGANTSHTVTWEMDPSAPTKIYLDGVLVETSTTPPRADVGSTAFGGYVERYQDSGASDKPAFLKIDTLTVEGTGAPPEEPPAPFWTAFVSSREIV